MGFLAPAFLLGALAVGVPLYLHLLRRHSGTPLPFSSLMLFEPRQQSAVRRRRLRYLLLLALRLAVLLLLALAFAEPYINRVGAALAPQKLLLLVIDDSFSMHAGGRLDAAKREALAVLAGKRAADRARIVTLDAQVRVLTAATQDTTTLRAAIQSVTAGDERGSFAALPGALRSMLESERAPIELHLFSDMQKSATPPAFAEMRLPGNVTLVLHPLAGGPAPNWSVESVDAPAQLWGAQRTHVQAVIAGYGTPAAVRIVSFLANGKVLGTRRVQVPPSGRATAQIDSFEVPYGFSRCAVRIDAADSLPGDDEYLFAMERSDPKRGLFIHQSSDARSPLYFGTALASAEERAVMLDTVAAERTADLDPKSYAFVVVSDVATLPAGFAERLAQYVSSGGSVLIALGTTSAQQRSVPLFGSAVLAARYYARGPERFAAVASADASYAPVGAQSQWEGVKFFYANAVDATGARVALRLADGTPLLLEKPHGEGRILVFASAFDNLTNDLPLQPSFVAFVDRTVHYLAGDERRSSSRTVDDFITLRAARERAVSVEVIDPLGQRPLSLQEAASAASIRLTHAGFYELRRADGRRELLAANPDRRESDLTPLSPETLALWRGNRSSTVSTAENGSAAPAPRAVAVRGELWWYAMWLVLAAVLAESILASRYLGTLREQ